MIHEDIFNAILLKNVLWGGGEGSCFSMVTAGVHLNSKMFFCGANCEPQTADFQSRASKQEDVQAERR